MTITTYAYLVEEAPEEFVARLDVYKNKDGTWDVGIPCPARQSFFWHDTRKKTKKAALAMRHAAAHLVLLEDAAWLEAEANKMLIHASKIRLLALRIGRHEER